MLLIALPGTAPLQQNPREQMNIVCSGPSGNGRCGRRGPPAQAAQLQPTSALHMGEAFFPGLVSPATSGLTNTNNPDFNGHLREMKDEKHTAVRSEDPGKAFKEVSNLRVSLSRGLIGITSITSLSSFLYSSRIAIATPIRYKTTSMH